jgi:hypothetical protein
MACLQRALQKSRGILLPMPTQQGDSARNECGWSATYPINRENHVLSAFLAAQHFFIRSLAAFLRAAAAIRRRGRSALTLTTRPAPFAKMNSSGSSSLSNESRRCGNNSIRYFTSCTTSRSRASAPRFASSNRWRSGSPRGMSSPECAMVMERCRTPSFL